MHLKSSGITGKFARFMELPEALIRSFFSTVVAGFEAYGVALCGNVASACPTEPEPSRIESKPLAIRTREPGNEDLRGCGQPFQPQILKAAGMPALSYAGTAVMMRQRIVRDPGAKVAWHSGQD